MPSPTSMPDLVRDFRVQGRAAIELRDNLVAVRRRYTALDAGNTLASTFAESTEGAANVGILRADFVNMVSNLDALITSLDVSGRMEAIGKVAY
jgi:hypothetical protein